MTFKQWAAGTCPPMPSTRAAHEAMLAELRKPRSPRPTIILVRNVQEAERLQALMAHAPD